MPGVDSRVVRLLLEAGLVHMQRETQLFNLVMLLCSEQQDRTNAGWVWKRDRELLGILASVGWP